MYRIVYMLISSSVFSKPEEEMKEEMRFLTHDWSAEKVP